MEFVRISVPLVGFVLVLLVELVFIHIYTWVVNPNRLAKRKEGTSLGVRSLLKGQIQFLWTQLMKKIALALIENHATMQLGGGIDF